MLNIKKFSKKMLIFSTLFLVSCSNVEYLKDDLSVNEAKFCARELLRTKYNRTTEVYENNFWARISYYFGKFNDNKAIILYMDIGWHAGKTGESYENEIESIGNYTFIWNHCFTNPRVYQDGMVYTISSAYENSVIDDNIVKKLYYIWTNDEQKEEHYVGKTIEHLFIE